MPNFVPSQSNQKPTDPTFTGKLTGSMNGGSAQNSDTSINSGIIGSKSAGTEQTADNFPGQSGGFNKSQNAKGINSANANPKNPAS